VRLLRYAVSGGLSAATHFGLGYALAGAGVGPVAAWTAGVVGSIHV
jgi:putative flippase GtrA